MQVLDGSSDMGIGCRALVSHQEDQEIYLCEEGSFLEDVLEFIPLGPRSRDLKTISLASRSIEICPSMDRCITELMIPGGESASYGCFYISHSSQLDE